jgi:hypothetical protein
MLSFIRDKTDSFFGKQSTCNRHDNRCYNVIADEKAIEASHIVGYLNNFSLVFIEHMRKKHIFEPTTPGRRAAVLRLLDNYNPETLTENISSGPDDTSYVENKGKKFALCLRNKRGQLHDTHLLEFVILHELSHLADANYGHGPSFWKIFKFFLQEAQSIGLHNPKNYSKEPEMYCGMLLESSPIYDNISSSSLAESFRGTWKKLERMIPFYIPKGIAKNEVQPKKDSQGVAKVLY